MITQEVSNFIESFYSKYYMASFASIGYRSVRGGKWTWEIDCLIGNTYLTNDELGFKPMFNDDIEASEAVILFCKRNIQFKNKQHMEMFDFLPL